MKANAWGVSYTMQQMLWFWICTPRVPGGKRRVYVTDDFGTLREIDTATVVITAR